MPSLGPLYDFGASPQVGQFIMIVGKSGSQKSAFAMYLCEQMGLSTLYFAGDMTPQECGMRMANMKTGQPSEVIEREIEAGNLGKYVGALESSNVSFSFQSPIKWRSIDNELNAYVEVHDKYPDVIVIDNLMDIEGCDTGYEFQSAAMQDLKALSRRTGVTIIVLHHATEKSPRGRDYPYKPSSRSDILNSLTQNPQLILSVALEPTSNEFRVAVVKQRSGPSDQSAETWATLQSEPELCRFGPVPTFGALT